jgi:hypothetical protein
MYLISYCGVGLPDVRPHRGSILKTCSGRAVSGFSSKKGAVMHINLGPGQRTPSLVRHAGIAVIGCFALTIPLASANAGFFDFLFAPLQPAAPVYRPQPHVYRPHFEHRQRAYSGHKKALAARSHKIVEAKIPRALTHGRIDLMDDDSLKDGDAVMTEGGIRIFVGSEGSHHRSDDFAQISEAESLSRRERAALLAMDPRHEGGHEGERSTQPKLLVGRSAADPRLSAGEMIVDPRGNQIRYVGP